MRHYCVSQTLLARNNEANEAADAGPKIGKAIVRAAEQVAACKWEQDDDETDDGEKVKKGAFEADTDTDTDTESETETDTEEESERNMHDLARFVVDDDDEDEDCSISVEYHTEDVASSGDDCMTRRVVFSVTRSSSTQPMDGLWYLKWCAAELDEAFCSLQSYSDWRAMSLAVLTQIEYTFEIYDAQGRYSWAERSFADDEPGKGKI